MYKSVKTFDYSKKAKNVIEDLPFDKLGAAVAEADDVDVLVAKFAESFDIKNKSWVYPQIISRIGKWSYIRNSSGLLSGKEVVKRNCVDDFNKGIYAFCMSDERFVDKQYVNSEYCRMVPLILSAAKKMANFSYYEWDLAELHFVVNPQLLEAMKTIPPEYSKEELLQFRVEGLTIKSGDKAGRTKSAISTYGLTGLPKELEDGRVGPAKLNKLIPMMLCQTWAAHPNNRNKYMILDPKSWESMPEPLIDEDVAPIVAKPTNKLFSGVWD